MRERVEATPEPPDSVVLEGHTAAAVSPPVDGQTAVDRSRVAERSLWHNREFMLFWVSETISLYGTQVTMLALPLTAVYALDASAGFVGALRFLEFAPFLALSLVLGAWVDRRRKRPVMVVANLARMVLVGLVPILAAVGWLNHASLVAIVVLVGIATVLFDVSWLAYVPSVVADRKSLAEANAKLGFSASSSEAAGPSLAGALVTALNAPNALGADAASYFVSVVLLLRLRTTEAKPSSPTQERHLRRELAEGVRLVWHDLRLRSVALIGLACNFVVMFVSSLFILYAVRTVKLSAFELGTILSIGATGAVLGSALAGRLLKRHRPGRLFSVAIAGVFLGPALIPAATGTQVVVSAIFVVALFTSYFGLSVANVIVLTLRQLITPPDMMARMSAAMRTTLFGGAALGGLVSGIAGDAFGLRGGLVAAAIVGAVVLVPCLRTPVARLVALPVEA